MNFLNSFTIRAKLMFFALLVSFFIGGLTAFNVYTIKKLNQEQEYLIATLINPALTLTEVIQKYASVRIALRDLILETDMERKKGVQKRLETDYMPKSIEILEKFLVDVSDQGLKEKIKATIASTKAYYEDVPATMSLSSDEAFPKILGPMKKKAQKARDEQVALYKDVNELIIQAETLMREQGEFAIRMMVIGAIITIVLVNIFLFLIGRSILKPVNILVQNMKDISTGDADLTKVLTVSGKDEVSQFATAFNLFVAHMRDLVIRINQTAGALQISGEKLQENAHRTSQTAEHISTQVEAIAATSEEVSVASTQISENCQHVATSSDRAHETAQNGAQSVEKLVLSIGEVSRVVDQSAQAIANLGAQSDKIGDIVSTIKEIAEQTNLLALNAAIEAARAGDTGRGFAVVADEVRKLAERTTRATSEIESVIAGVQSETSSAVASMQEGVQIVSKSSVFAQASRDSLTSIVNENMEVTHQTQGIFATSQEQSSAITGVAVNIQSISESAEQNAQVAAEASSLAKQLHDLVAELNSLTHRFAV